MQVYGQLRKLLVGENDQVFYGLVYSSETLGDCLQCGALFSHLPTAIEFFTPRVYHPDQLKVHETEIRLEYIEQIPTADE